MQIKVEIPDKLGQKFSKKERKKIILDAFRNKVETKKSLKEEPFFKWAFSKKNTGKEKNNDVAQNHDKYLYGDKS